MTIYKITLGHHRACKQWILAQSYAHSTKERNNLSCPTSVWNLSPKSIYFSAHNHAAARVV